jgi:hypothetical protein
VKNSLNITFLPKRMLTAAEAAFHCGRPVKRFLAECPVQPVQFSNGDHRYDVRELDRWLDALSDGPSDEDEIVDRLG